MERTATQNVNVDDLVNGHLNDMLGGLELAHQIEFIKKANMLFLNKLKIEREVRAKKMEGMSVEINYILATMNDLQHFEQEIANMAQKETIDYAGDYKSKITDESRVKNMGLKHNATENY
jgi:hypothetical protein